MVGQTLTDGEERTENKPDMDMMAQRVIPATQETEERGSHIQGQPGQL